MKKIENRKIQKIIEKEISKLKRNECFVIEHRFGLGVKKCTLAGIGRKLNLSRERARQIEKEALKKLSKIVAKNYRDIAEKIHKLFEINGGIVSKEESTDIIVESKPADRDAQKNTIDLFITLIPEIEMIERHEEIHDSWILAKVPKTKVVKILKEWAKYLETSKKPNKIDVLISNHPNHKKHSTSFLSALPRVSRKIIENYEGDLGLTSWPEICPKTVRDKIYYILKKYQKPLHFTEIARVIKDEEFDNKKVVPATVHNELISDKRFVLIGRGIYALTQWGYVSGTVKEVIKDVLKKAGRAMNYSEIYFQVSKQRRVRKNTILINLQTQKDFRKLSNGKYSLV